MVAMPRPYLAVTADRRVAALTAVGKQILVALGAVLRVFFHYVLLSQQGVFAVMAVKTLAGGHCRLLFSAGDHRKQEEHTIKEERGAEDKKNTVVRTKSSHFLFYSFEKA